MSNGFENKAEGLKGDIKEGVGKMTGNDKMETEGATESKAADAKEGARSVGDKISGAAEGLKNSLGGDKN